LLPEPTAGRAAREFVRAACRDWNMDEDMCDDAALIATELVANVVDHARTACVVTLSRDDTKLLIDVADSYPCAMPGPKPLATTALRGRGLQMVAGISAEWGVRDLPGGKSVWAVLGDDSGPLQSCR